MTITWNDPKTATCALCGDLYTYDEEYENCPRCTEARFDNEKGQGFDPNNDKYNTNCDERSWGEDCDAQREPLPFSVKCGAGCGRTIQSNTPLPPTTLCYVCEQDIPF